MQTKAKTSNYNEVEKKKARFSGVELLRIIAILLICLSHSLDTSRGFVDYSPSYDFINIFVQILMASGQIGNVLFIICSAYFLVDSKKTKADKAFNLLLDSSLISIIIFSSFLIGGYSFTTEDWIRQFLPDLFEHNWFIGIYVIMYAVHPLLNTIIHNIGQKAHFTLCFAIFLFFSVVGFILSDEIAVGYLAHFFMVYFIVAYMKLYCSDFANNRKKNVKWFLIFLSIFFVGGFLDKIAPNWHPYLSRFISLDSWFTPITLSPITLPMLLFLFNIFKSFKFQNKFINYLASCSLFVYLFHENILLRTYIRPKYYEYVMGINPDLYFWWIMLCAVEMFIGGMILSVIYKETLHRLTNYLSKKLAIGFYKLRDFAFTKINKEELKFNNSSLITQENTTLNLNSQEINNNIEKDTKIDTTNLETKTQNNNKKE